MASYLQIIDGVAPALDALNGYGDTPALFSTRTIGDIVADVTVEEEHSDELTITDHPVETGASITDHAFKNPSRLTLRIGFWNGSARSTGDTYVNDTYQAFLDLQKSRQPFGVSTGKRRYENMLIQAIGVTTDDVTSQTLAMTLALREIIMVESTFSATSNADDQADPASTSSGLDTGVRQAVPAPGSIPGLTDDQIFGFAS